MTKPFDTGDLHPAHVPHVLRAYITRLEAIAREPDAFADADHEWAKANAHLLDHEAKAAPRRLLKERPAPTPKVAVMAPPQPPKMDLDLDAIQERWARRHQAGHLK